MKYRVDYHDLLDDFRKCLGLSHDLFTVSHRFLDRYHDVLESSYLDVKTIHRGRLVVYHRGDSFLFLISF